MLDIKWIRDNQDAFVKGLSDRFPERDPRELLTQILSLDEERRATIQQLQEAQARRNAASKEIGQAMAAKDTAKAEALKTEVAALKTAIQDGEGKERDVVKPSSATCSPPFPICRPPMCRSEPTPRPMSSCAKSARRRNFPSSRSSISSSAKRSA